MIIFDVLSLQVPNLSKEIDYFLFGHGLRGNQQIACLLDAIIVN